MRLPVTKFKVWPEQSRYMSRVTCLSISKFLCCSLDAVFKCESAAHFFLGGAAVGLPPLLFFREYTEPVGVLDHGYVDAEVLTEDHSAPACESLCPTGWCLVGPRNWDVCSGM